eukprot:TRINITY_DN36344_c0_g1_i1.p1 TRINITY_DN36344_c0_g1~~TRINITY_DN36344_c0_g1_i1.p1  ORF type:complete len:1309 (-),score=334.06 TRINITY_DN36344_c0_g1_i1:876-4802(-)
MHRSLWPLAALLAAAPPAGCEEVATPRCCAATLGSEERFACADFRASSEGSSASPGGPSFLVLQVATQDADEYAPTAAAVNAAWVERFGHYGLTAKRTGENWQEVWRAGKVDLLAEALKRHKAADGPDYFLYLDADAVLADFSEDTFKPLLAQHPHAHILVSREPMVKASKATAQGGNDWSGGKQDFNNGVLLVQNSDWSRQFVKEWRRRLAAQKARNDQEVLQEMYDEGVAGVKQKLTVLPPGEINSQMGLPVVEEGQRVIHLGGLPNSVRAHIFSSIHDAICKGEFLAFGGEGLQEAFLKAMRAAADTPLPSDTGKAQVNGWIQIRQRLGLALQQLERMDEAAHEMGRVWQSRSDLFGRGSLDALQALLHYGHAAGDASKLLEAWSGLSKLRGPANSESQAAASLVTEALMKEGRFEEALEPAQSMEQDADIGPSLRTIIQHNIGIQRMGQKRYQEAENLLRRAADEILVGGTDLRQQTGAKQMLQNIAGALVDLGGPQRTADARELRRLAAGGKPTSKLSQVAGPSSTTSPPAMRQPATPRPAEGEADSAGNLRAAELKLREAIAAQQAQQGSAAEAHNDLGILLLSWKGQDRSEEAAGHFRKAADVGDARAQANLATLFLQGRPGVERDSEAAASLYRAAAAGGQELAQYNLFRLLEAGRAGASEKNEALKWLQAAAKSGLLQAQAELADRYHRGLGGVSQNDEKAAKWYGRAAAGGDANSQFYLGMLHATGKGVALDQGKANALYTKAAEQGHAVAQTNLGFVHRYGYGVRPNATAAAVWFRRAADQGAVQAQFSLAEMLDSKQGGAVNVLPEKDDKEAGKWYIAAAEQDHTEAQYRIGCMLAEGRGVKRGSEKKAAAAWLRAAARGGHAAASLRAALLLPSRPRGAAVISPPAAASLLPGGPQTLRTVHESKTADDASVPSVYGSGEDCPFKNIDLVLYTGLRDSALLPYLLQSIQLFMPCYGKLRAIVPAAEVPLVHAQLAAAVGAKLRLYPEELPPWLEAISWVWRIAYTALYLDVIINAEDGEAPEYVAFLDSDVVLAYPVTCADIFDPKTGKPWAFYWPHIVHGNAANTERLFNSSVGEHRLGSFMSYFPQVYPLDAFRLLRQRLQAAYGGISFEEAFRRHADVGNMDFYSLIAHAVYFDEQAATSMAFAACPPAAQAATGAGERCVDTAHVGVHVPYPWHHCVAHAGPGCSESFPKFDPKPGEGEVGRPSGQFTLTAGEILHRGICFAHKSYGGGSLPRSCQAAIFAGGAAGDGEGDVHWRVWAYTDDQLGRAGGGGQRQQRLVEKQRTRTSCLPAG